LSVAPAGVCTEKRSQARSWPTMMISVPASYSARHRGVVRHPGDDRLDVKRG
jgi:hypothetical protein